MLRLRCIFRFYVIIHQEKIISAKIEKVDSSEETISIVNLPFSEVNIGGLDVNLCNFSIFKSNLPQKIH